jgi:hypothetical protein
MAERPTHFTLPMGLRRVAAAAYCGVSPGHFDRMVKEGVMPAPRDQSGVKTWLRNELEEALYALPIMGNEGGGNSCDEAFGL